MKKKSKPNSRWLPFKEAREYVRSLKLGSRGEWQKFIKGDIPEFEQKPYDIPNTPSTVYSNDDWVSWYDWLGKHDPRESRSFEKAKRFVRSLNLQSKEEWIKYKKGKLPSKGKKPADIPAFPELRYKHKGWLNWGDWLGTGRVATRQRAFRSFEEACQYVRELGVKTSIEWRKLSKGKLFGKSSLPSDIPAAPYLIYRSKWISWPDFLGTDTNSYGNIVFWSFDKAKEFVRSLNLKNSKEWSKYCKGEMPQKGKKPKGIPFSPPSMYKNKGWKGWGDFLGTGNIAPRNKNFKSFKDARKYVRSLKLKKGTDWHKYCKNRLPGKAPKPADIPRMPHLTYKNKGWKGWPDFLSIKNSRPLKSP